LIDLSATVVVDADAFVKDPIADGSPRAIDRLRNYGPRFEAGLRR
jgi:hypothetical protein